MSRRRSIGLALVAAFAFSAVAVASAEPPDEYEYSGAAGTTFTGKQLATQKFKTNAGTVECKKAKYEGVVPATKKSTTAKVKYTYSECEVPGIGSATVENKGCEYEFLEPIDNEPETGDKVHHGKVSVISEAGKTCETVITAVTCKVTVKAQSSLEKVTATNNKPAAGNSEITPEVKGITYTDSSFCPGGAGTFTNGEYTGKNEVTGVLIN
ncbi:MAG: hypothetical protein E6G34_06535 [Actinobacteria bacterium]|nr:MAG: hypothetical protein E6G34_06535 [Actinomycetota bacterium]